MVMSHCQSPLDLFKFASTCKALQKIYKNLEQLRSAKKNIFRGGIASNLRNRFGAVACPDYCYSVARYRRLRHEFDGLSLAKIEKVIRARFLDATVPHERSAKDLFHIPRALDDAEVLVNAFVAEAWKNVDAFKALGYLRPGYEAKIIVLTPSEKARFLKSVFQYQHYCHMFFYKDEILFSMNTLLRRQFFKVQHGDLTEVLRFHSIVAFISTFYRGIVDTMRCTPVSEIRALGSKETVEYFLSSSFIEIIRFVHYLLCNGMRMFAKVCTRDPYSRTKFLLKEFYKIKITRHPAITVSGFDVADQGTHGEKTWTPWPYTEEVLKSEFDPALRSAIMFWDRERLENVEKAAAPKTLEGDEKTEPQTPS
ncbi:hypothetical protein FSPOR_9235 [Fusarium sporotrichioides]|uniref:Uncharacterized protein n=1 Tax=Fusarium sporotrichioides TaxID=5514 RepID=A0A395RRB9_FUSSP|nr:hypothetical protein FSPOR_9235 [Fusarium sporotrichioides]